MNGTIHEFIAGYMKREVRDKPIALVPGGTGNGTCVSLGILNGEIAAEYILAGTHTGFDLNKVTTSRNEVFYSHCLIGPWLVHDGNKLAESCRCCGPCRYDLAAVCYLCKGYYLQGKLTLDKQYEIEGPFTVMFVQNSPTFKLGAPICPLAAFNSGTMEIVLMPKANCCTHMGAFMVSKDGSHINEDIVRTYRCSHLQVESAQGGLNVDGENIPGATPFEVECVQDKIRVMFASKMADIQFSSDDDNIKSPLIQRGSNAKEIEYSSVIRRRTRSLG